jgi:protein involved in polysaccharide export with SLBB domain
MFRMKKLAAGLAALVAVVGLGFGLTGGTSPRAEAQAPRPTQPADDLKTQRERLDKEIAATKERIKQLETEKLRLGELERLNKDLEELMRSLEASEKAKKAPVEPHILVTARPVSTPGYSFNNINNYGTRLGGTTQLGSPYGTSNFLGTPLGGTTFLGSPQGMSNLGGLSGPGMLQPGAQLNTLQPDLRYFSTYQPAQAGGGSELVVKEFTGPGKPVIEAHFHDVRSLQTYLIRAAKDPAAPKKLKLQIHKDYLWTKAKAVIDACKAAGFGAIELVSAPTGKGAPARAAAPAAGAPYVIEMPDVIRVEVQLRDGEKLTALPGQAVSGDYVVRPDGTVSLGRYGPVKVAGLQIPSAANAIRAHIAAHELVKEKVNRPEDLSISLDVVRYNSKKYYVISDEPEGQQVAAFPLTGNETVLDAIGNVAGLAARAETATIGLARLGSDGRPAETLPVDWKGITEQGRTETNYQLMPGDRVYVKPMK